MELTTGQMIDTLQIGQIAVANDDRKTYVKRNSLGYYWTFQGDKKKAWRLLQIDSITANLKWTIQEN
ncbi:hypothetical protein D7X33_27885 [Butyricicoccus sp. 1XD8-22]|nr:hypothetical protein D7X33_27885 [Butyricicoccus sp. 1XD8-22]